MQTFSIVSLFTRVIAILLLAFTMSAAAQDIASPSAKVETTVNAILGILRDDSIPWENAVDMMREEVFKAFDARAIAQSVLSTNWRQANEQQQEEFQQLFIKNLEVTYVDRLKAYTNESVEIRGEEINNNRATVDTVVFTASNEVPVTYRLRLRSDGWFVYDVVIENVSMISSYRETYRSIVRKDGIDGMLTQMREKAAPQN